MTLLTNSEISKTYNVAKPTVASWIENALQKNNSLNVIIGKNGKYQIENSENNLVEMHRLCEEGKKFKTKDQLVKTTPTEYFYQTYNLPEIVEIVNSIQTRSEIPHKFVYKGLGGLGWNQYFESEVLKGNYQNPVKLSKLLEDSLPSILSNLKPDQTINVIEIGPGNAEPTIPFLQSLIEKEKLSKYIPIDISAELVHIAATNAQTKIPGLQVVGITGDIETLDLATVLFENSDVDTVNIILYLGSTIGIHQNRAKVLDNIRQGLSDNDLFIFSNTIESDKTKTRSDYANSVAAKEQNQRILKNLGVEVENCEQKFWYDEKLGGKFLAVMLNKDYLVDLSQIGTNKSLYLEKGTAIIVWRLHMTNLVTVAQELSQSGLLQVGLLTDKERTHCLVLCQAM